MRVIRKIYVIIVLSMVLSIYGSTIVNAGYVGPVDVMNTTFGDRPEQIVIEKQDTEYLFTEDYYILGAGLIAISDGYAIKLFGPAGFIRSFNVLRAPGFTAEVKLFREGAYVIGSVRDATGSLKNDIYYYDYQGNLTRTIKYGSYVGGVLTVLSNGEFVTQRQQTYYKYSPSGQLIKTYSSKPLELGVEKGEIPLGNGYRHIIEYPDQTYNFVIPNTNIALNSYLRVSQGNLLLAAKTNTNDLVFKLSRCGKVVGSLQMPDNVKGPSRKIGIEEYSTYLEEYGKPVFSEDGDVYTWKRTPDNYSILKWNWMDDPNVQTGPDAPTGLTLMPSTTGLYLTWTASPNDPGCVTGYEVARATTAGGVTSTVATVNAGVVKYNDTTADAGTMYYYKVRAKAGSEYSPYTTEVSGKR